MTPPWQSFEGLGGPARVRALSWRGGAVVVDNDWRVVPLTPPAGFGAAAFEQGGVLRHLVRGELPPRTEVEDAFGYASGALAWDLELAPGAARDVHVAVPFAERPALGPVTQAEVPVASLTTLDGVTRYWERKLAAVGLRLPASAEGCVDTVRTATGHILINRDGPAIQPGPRRYTRSWVRDCVIMGAALAKAGLPFALREFLTWYAPFQREDGFVPCVVDRDGVDWLVEHDSHGQFSAGVREVLPRRDATGNSSEKCCPTSARPPHCLEALRAERLTTAYPSPANTPPASACYRNPPATKAILPTTCIPTGTISGASAGWKPPPISRR